MYIDSFYHWSCGLPLRPTPCAMSFGFHGAEVCRLNIGYLIANPAKFVG